MSSLLYPKKSETGVSLDVLLRRKDVWRGHSQKFIAQEVIDTGHDALNALLLHGGWPQGCLVELGQTHFSGAWFLLSAAARIQLEKPESGVLGLLNPPEQPCAINLLQMALPLEDVLLLRPQNKAEFIASFVELAKSPACSMIMAWSPRQALSYAELRKCQLATQEQAGLYVLFRHIKSMQQSSPAALRLILSLKAESMYISLLKQKGRRPGDSVKLALPDAYMPDADYRDLLEHDAELVSNKVLQMPFNNKER